jgi:hypothetical protein
LPPGFLALDLAKEFGLPLLDPDQNYALVANGHYPKFANGVIGEDKNHPKLVVAVNGGSDLVYITDGNQERAGRIVQFLLGQDYISGFFVDDRLGAFRGTLPLSSVMLKGSAITPVPAIVVSFRSFDTVCGEPLLCTVEVADTALQRVRGCTDRSAEPTPKISWRFRVPISKLVLSTLRQRAMPTSRQL